MKLGRTACRFEPLLVRRIPIMPNEEGMPEDPTPDQNRKGDMGKGSLQESQDRNKGASQSKQGPRRVPVRKIRTAKK
jgi:hypothetical protein